MNTRSTRRRMTRSTVKEKPSITVVLPRLRHAAELVEDESAHRRHVLRLEGMADAPRRARRASPSPTPRSARPSSLRIGRSSSSFSSRMSPTISSRMSSMVTSPAVPPYSSTTIARWLCDDLKSRSCDSDRLPLGDERRRADLRLPPARGLLAVDHRRQDVLGEEDAGDRVERVVVHREARVLRAPHAVHDLRPRRVVLDADDVHARHHHLLHLGLGERGVAAEDVALDGRQLRLRLEDGPVPVRTALPASPSRGAAGGQRRSIRSSSHLPHAVSGETPSSTKRVSGSRRASPSSARRSPKARGAASSSSAAAAEIPSASNAAATPPRSCRSSAIAAAMPVSR